MKALTFNKSTPHSFEHIVKLRVKKEFAHRGISPKGNWGMVVKAGFGISLWIGSYLLLFVFPGYIIPIYLLHGLASVFLLMNVAHDATHGATSSKKWVNESLSYTWKLCGISSYLWMLKHNVSHHPISLCFLLIPLCALGQKEKPKKSYETWVHIYPSFSPIQDESAELYQNTGINPYPYQKGFLYQLKDSSIILSETIPPSLETAQEINIRKIHKLKFRKEGGQLKAILIGFFAGAIAGLIVFRHAEDDIWFQTSSPGGWQLSFGPQFSTKKVLGPIGLGAVGAIIGTTVKINIPIKGNYQTYKKRREKLERFKY